MSLPKTSATYKRYLSDREYLPSNNGWIARKPLLQERKWLQDAGYTDFDLVEVHRCGDVFLQFGIKEGEGHETLINGGLQ